MDSSGNNRYELLFMDDEVSETLDNIGAKNKKQVKIAATAAGGGAGALPKSSNKQNVDGATNRQQSNKKPNQSEKENKPLAMNVNKKLFAVAGTSEKFTKISGGVVAASANTNRKRNGPLGVENREGGAGSGQGQRNVNFRQQNGVGGESREQRNNRRNVKENGFNTAGPVGGVEGSTSQPPRQFRDRDNRGGPPRNNRNFEGGNRTGKREFDRQSGSDKTGIKAIDKRDGAGAHNWGSVKEAIEDVNKNEVEGTATVEKADESGNEQAEQAPIEEETKELTLDEWKAQKQQRIKPTFNIRKAGEGEDITQWKKMIVLNNNKKKENDSEEELEFDPAMYPQRVGRQQRVLDIQFNFNDGRRGGGGGFGGRGRGGRGPRPGGVGTPVVSGSSGNSTIVSNVNGGSGERPAGRGGFEVGRSGGERYEGGARGGNTVSGSAGRGGKRNFGGDRQQQNAAPKVNDERQFPTLA